MPERVMRVVSSPTSAALAAAVVPYSAVDELRPRLLVQLESLERHARDLRGAEDPDGLKRLRVAARRIRSRLRAGRPHLEPAWAEPLRAELRWLGHSLGAAHDLDVLLAHIRSISERFDYGERFVLGRAIRKLEADRESAYREALSTVESRRCVELFARLAAELPKPHTRPSDLKLGDLAGGEHRRLCKAVRALAGVATDDELHSLRIRVKRARYAAELADGAVGQRATRYITRAKRLQDILGEHQDATVAETTIRRMLQRPQSIRYALAAGRLIERQAVRREQARAAFPAAWQALEKQGRAAWA
jgi:CHAD domain-containing protein